MIHSTAIRSTARFTKSDVEIFHQERPTVRITYAELSDLLFQDAMGDIEVDCSDDDVIHLSDEDIEVIA